MHAYLSGGVLLGPVKLLPLQLFCMHLRAQRMLNIQSSTSRLQHIAVRARSVSLLQRMSGGHAGHLDSVQPNRVHAFARRNC